LAAELQQALGVSAQLIEGGGGIFDVRVDGAMIYFKFDEGDRHPHPGEVLARILAL
jgi:predicted Rdx family selenoprotein